MSIVLELTPAEEEALRRGAGAHHVDVVTYIRAKVFPKVERPNPDGNRDPNGQVYRVDSALAVLDALEKPEFQVTESEWEALTKGIEQSRPGQRSVFGPGTNPSDSETKP